MADQTDDSVGGDHCCGGTEAEKRVCCGAVEDVGESTASSKDAVGGGDLGGTVGVMLGAEAGDALLRCLGG